MAKEDVIEVQGTVAETLPNAMSVHRSARNSSCHTGISSGFINTSNG